VEKEQIVEMASYALGQLIYGGSSVETAVRAVLRIANLLHHTRWQLWAYLQLNEGGGDDTTSAIAAQSLFRAFPLEMLGDSLHPGVEAQHTDIMEAAAEAVTATRFIGEDRVTTHSVREIEYLTAEGNEQVLRIVLTRIRNCAQAYLMSVEANQNPPAPYLRPE
jgi:hypothetical protein